MSRSDDPETRAADSVAPRPPVARDGDDADPNGGAPARAGADAAAAAERPSRPPSLREASLEALIREQIRRLDPAPGRDALERTPERVSEALTWMTRGHDMSLEEIFDGSVVEGNRDSLVLVKNVELYSLCEHHALPFYGRAHVAYLPDGRLVRSGELPRVVDVFARRLQIQERLTEQIAGAMEEGLEPKGVGVVVEAYHLCMMMRGVEKQNSKTVTSAVRGIFREDSRTREEFLRLVHASHEPG